MNSFLLFFKNGFDDVFEQMLNKEHEKAEDAKPTAVPPVAGS